MAHRFLSREWLDEGRRVVGSSAEFRRLVGDRSATIVTVIEGAPTGRPRYLRHEFIEGVLQRIESSANGPFAGRPPDFTISGPYEAFVALQRGTVTLQGAYFQRLIRLAGNIPEAMRFAPAFAKYQDLVRRVETEY